MTNYKHDCFLKDGAVLFCVHRAKFTEGHNFSGDLCNGLLLIGIPNLNIKSPKLILKELFYKNKKDKITYGPCRIIENFDSYYYRQTHKVITFNLFDF